MEAPPDTHFPPFSPPDETLWAPPHAEYHYFPLPASAFPARSAGEEPCFFASPFVEPSTRLRESTSLLSHPLQSLPVDDRSVRSPCAYPPLSRGASPSRPSAAGSPPPSQQTSPLSAGSSAANSAFPATSASPLYGQSHPSGGVRTCRLPHNVTWIQRLPDPAPAPFPFPQTDRGAVSQSPGWRGGGNEDGGDDSGDQAVAELQLGLQTEASSLLFRHHLVHSMCRNLDSSVKCDSSVPAPPLDRDPLYCGPAQSHAAAPGCGRLQPKWRTESLFVHPSFSSFPSSSPCSAAAAGHPRIGYPSLEPENRRSEGTLSTTVRNGSTSAAALRARPQEGRADLSSAAAAAQTLPSSIRPSCVSASPLPALARDGLPRPSAAPRALPHGPYAEAVRLETLHTALSVLAPSAPPGLACDLLGREAARRGTMLRGQREREALSAAAGAASTAEPVACCPADKKGNGCDGEGDEGTSFHTTRAPTTPEGGKYRSEPTSQSSGASAAGYRERDRKAAKKVTRRREGHAGSARQQRELRWLDGDSVHWFNEELIRRLGEYRMQQSETAAKTIQRAWRQTAQAREAREHVKARLLAELRRLESEGKSREDSTGSREQRKGRERKERERHKERRREEATSGSEREEMVKTTSRDNRNRRAGTRAGDRAKNQGRLSLLERAVLRVQAAFRGRRVRRAVMHVVESGRRRRAGRGSCEAAGPFRFSFSSLDDVDELTRVLLPLELKVLSESSPGNLASKTGADTESRQNQTPQDEGRQQDRRLQREAARERRRELRAQAILAAEISRLSTRALELRKALANEDDSGPPARGATGTPGRIVAKKGSRDPLPCGSSLSHPSSSHPSSSALSSSPPLSSHRTSSPPSLSPSPLFSRRDSLPEAARATETKEWRKGREDKHASLEEDARRRSGRRAIKSKDAEKEREGAPAEQRERERRRSERRRADHERREGDRGAGQGRERRDARQSTTGEREKRFQDRERSVRADAEKKPELDSKDSFLYTHGERETSSQGRKTRIDEGAWRAAEGSDSGAGGEGSEFVEPPEKGRKSERRRLDRSATCGTEPSDDSLAAHWRRRMRELEARRGRDKLAERRRPSRSTLPHETENGGHTERLASRAPASSHSHQLHADARERVELSSPLWEADAQEGAARCASAPRPSSLCRALGWAAVSSSPVDICGRGGLRAGALQGDASPRASLPLGSPRVAAAAASWSEASGSTQVGTGGWGGGDLDIADLDESGGYESADGGPADAVSILAAAAAVRRLGPFAHLVFSATPAAAAAPSRAPSASLRDVAAPLPAPSPPPQLDDAKTLPSAAGAEASAQMQAGEAEAQREAQRREAEDRVKALRKHLGEELAQREEDYRRRNLQRLSASSSRLSRMSSLACLSPGRRASIGADDSVRPPRGLEAPVAAEEKHPLLQAEGAVETAANAVRPPQPPSPLYASPLEEATARGDGDEDRSRQLARRIVAAGRVRIVTEMSQVTLVEREEARRRRALAERRRQVLSASVSPRSESEPFQIRVTEPSATPTMNDFSSPPLSSVSPTATRKQTEANWLSAQEAERRVREGAAHTPGAGATEGGASENDSEPAVTAQRAVPLLRLASGPQGAGTREEREGDGSAPMSSSLASRPPFLPSSLELRQAGGVEQPAAEEGDTPLSGRGHLRQPMHAATMKLPARPHFGLRPRASSRRSSTERLSALASDRTARWGSVADEEDVPFERRERATDVGAEEASNAATSGKQPSGSDTERFFSPAPRPECSTHPSPPTIRGLPPAPRGLPCARVASPSVPPSGPSPMSPSGNCTPPSLPLTGASAAPGPRPLASLILRREANGLVAVGAQSARGSPREEAQDERGRADATTREEGQKSEDAEAEVPLGSSLSRPVVPRLALPPSLPAGQPRAKRLPALPLAGRRIRSPSPSRTCASPGASLASLRPLSPLEVRGLRAKTSSAPPRPSSSSSVEAEEDASPAKSGPDAAADLESSESGKACGKGNEKALRENGSSERRTPAAGSPASLDSPPSSSLLFTALRAPAVTSSSSPLSAGASPSSDSPSPPRASALAASLLAASLEQKRDGVLRQRETARKGERPARAVSPLASPRPLSALALRGLRARESSRGSPPETKATEARMDAQPRREEERARVGDESLRPGEENAAEGTKQAAGTERKGVGDKAPTATVAAVQRESREQQTLDRGEVRDAGAVKDELKTESEPWRRNEGNPHRRKQEEDALRELFKRYELRRREEGEKERRRTEHFEAETAEETRKLADTLKEDGETDEAHSLEEAGRKTTDKGFPAEPRTPAEAPKKTKEAITAKVVAGNETVQKEQERQTTERSNRGKKEDEKGAEVKQKTDVEERQKPEEEERRAKEDEASRTKGEEERRQKEADEREKKEEEEGRKKTAQEERQYREAEERQKEEAEERQRQEAVEKRKKEAEERRKKEEEEKRTEEEESRNQETEKRRLKEGEERQKREAEEKRRKEAEERRREEEEERRNQEAEKRRLKEEEERVTREAEERRKKEEEESRRKELEAAQKAEEARRKQQAEEERKRREEEELKKKAEDERRAKEERRRLIQEHLERRREQEKLRSMQTRQQQIDMITQQQGKNADLLRRRVATVQIQRAWRRHRKRLFLKRNREKRTLSTGALKEQEERREEAARKEREKRHEDLRRRAWQAAETRRREEEECERKAALERRMREEERRKKEDEDTKKREEEEKERRAKEQRRQELWEEQERARREMEARRRRESDAAEEAFEIETQRRRLSSPFPLPAALLIASADTSQRPCPPESDGDDLSFVSPPESLFSQSSDEEGDEILALRRLQQTLDEEARKAGVRTFAPIVQEAEDGPIARSLTLYDRSKGKTEVVKQKTAKTREATGLESGDSRASGSLSNSDRERGSVAGQRILLVDSREEEARNSEQQPRQARDAAASGAGDEEGRNREGKRLSASRESSFGEESRLTKQSSDELPRIVLHMSSWHPDDSSAPSQSSDEEESDSARWGAQSDAEDRRRSSCARRRLEEEEARRRVRKMLREAIDEKMRRSAEADTPTDRGSASSLRQPHQFSELEKETGVRRTPSPRAPVTLTETAEGIPCADARPTHARKPRGASENPPRVTDSPGPAGCVSRDTERSSSLSAPPLSPRRASAADILGRHGYFFRRRTSAAGGSPESGDATPIPGNGTEKASPFANQRGGTLSQSGSPRSPSRLGGSASPSPPSSSVISPESGRGSPISLDDSQASSGARRKAGGNKRTLLSPPAHTFFAGPEEVADRQSSSAARELRRAETPANSSSEDISRQAFTRAGQDLSFGRDERGVRETGTGATLVNGRAGVEEELRVRRGKPGSQEGGNSRTNADQERSEGVSGVPQAPPSQGVGEGREASTPATRRPAAKSPADLSDARAVKQNAPATVMEGRGTQESLAMKHVPSDRPIKPQAGGAPDDARASSAGGQAGGAEAKTALSEFQRREEIGRAPERVSQQTCPSTHGSQRPHPSAHDHRGHDDDGRRLCREPGCPCQMSEMLAQIERPGAVAPADRPPRSRSSAGIPLGPSPVPDLSPRSEEGPGRSRSRRSEARVPAMLLGDDFMIGLTGDRRRATANKTRDDDDEEDEHE
ncbi:hypothetical protein BESB_074870 [Besnoitia besnoiti]|uniref:IQ calmodulin-binding motif domain-containing protein n=1 Tax=Besnoitia besnoiti TaxID=94643 RepID=A0A2A9M8N7_BESBE|nr:uncharacterized protein BESB_074870 [Besnoitia besnoiti]PFH34335.1 hypothetical protein BESB_074870 [Besnoitia besnoiti]